MTEKNPAVPQDGHAILIGVIGISHQWYYFDDTAKGRDQALKWLQEGTSPKRMFRVYFSDPEELTVCPPVPARLVSKPASLKQVRPE